MDENKVSLKFIKKAFGFTEDIPNVIAASKTEYNTIMFDSSTKQIYVDGISFGGTISDVTFNPETKILTIQKNNGSEQTLDFSDAATAEATFHVFGHLNEIIGLDSDGKIDYSGTNFIGEEESLISADKRLDSVLKAISDRVGEAEAGITALGTRVGEAESSITALGTRVGEAESSITALGTRVGESEAGIIALGTRVGEAEAGIIALGTRVGESEAGIIALGTRVGEAEDKIGTLTESDTIEDDYIDPYFKNTFNNDKIEVDDTLSDAIHKVDDKAFLLTKEIIDNEEICKVTFTLIQNSVGLDEGFELVLERSSTIEEPEYIDEDAVNSFNQKNVVETDDNIAEALHKIDEKNSMLAEKVIDNEETVTNTVIKMLKSIGLNEKLEYEADENANIIYNATSLSKADSLLDKAISNMWEFGEFIDSRVNDCEDDISDIYGRLDDAGKVNDITLNGDSIVVNKTADLGTLTESSTYGTTTMSEDAKTSFNTTNKITTSDSLPSAIHKVDEKAKKIVDEIISDEQVLQQVLFVIKDNAGLQNDFTFVPDTGSHYISDATSIADAINKLDAALYALASSLNS